METCKNCSHGSSCSKCSGNLALGLLAGVAIAVAVGMLFSPQKGTVLRRIILRKGEDIADDVVETIEDRIGQFSHIVSEKLETLKDDLVSRFSSVTESIKNG
jgi:gas vesicle protein